MLCAGEVCRVDLVSYRLWQIKALVQWLQNITTGLNRLKGVTVDAMLLQDLDTSAPSLELYSTAICQHTYNRKA